MIDLSLYRFRIGTFSCSRVGSRHSYKKGQKTRQIGKILVMLRLILLFSILKLQITGRLHQPNLVNNEARFSCRNFVKTGVNKTSEEYRPCSQNQSVNFKARYKYGNINKENRGIRSFHLNIRSIGNKMSEVKNLVKEQKPHIFGLSETELRKVQNKYDERKLKIPGYNLLFPKSWSLFGYARVLVYVKSSLEYQQVHELEGDVVQSVWLKGGHKNSKRIYFCHFYREHTSSLGNSMQSQKQYLESLLHQWEEATEHGQAGELNEVHAVGDMNIDTLDGKWLRSDYHLISLSRILRSACDTGNFSQLVSQPTRAQFNSASGVTNISCIDHIYTNFKFRCSTPSCVPFGASDHDLIGYTRFSKDPPSPAKL